MIQCGMAHSNKLGKTEMRCSVHRFCACVSVCVFVPMCLHMCACVCVYQSDAMSSGFLAAHFHCPAARPTNEAIVVMPVTEEGGT